MLQTRRAITQPQNRLIWIPSHSGIKDNEVVDKLANQAHEISNTTIEDYLCTAILETEEGCR